MNCLTWIVRPRVPMVSVIVAMLLAFALLPALFSIAVYSQARQLSLADILIGLRSRKASLADRNKILSEAVGNRGTTFSLTPEIEKELSVTGADTVLIGSIRAQKTKPSIVNASTTDPGPKTAADPPTIQDLVFFQNRANESAAKGDTDAAIIDYTKAIEMNPSSYTSFLGRGTSYLASDRFTLAIADLSKVIELDPQNADAYTRRGQAYEKKSDQKLAIEDYKRALQLDPANEIAKTAVERWTAEQAKVIKAPVSVPEIASPDVALPEWVELGTLNESQTIKIIKPSYSQAAIQARLSGKVIVEVELDIEGNVTKAKAISGHPYLRGNSEVAARDSKFKPSLIGNVPVKAKGRIVYNFVPQTFR